MTFRSSSHGIHARALSVLVTAAILFPCGYAYADDRVHRTAPAAKDNIRSSESRAGIHRKIQSKRHGGNRSRTGAESGKPIPELKTKKEPSRDGIPEFSMEIPR